MINLTADETRDRSFVSVSHSFGSLQNTKQTKWTLNATQNHHSECFQVDSSFGSSQESTGCIDESLGCCDHVLVLVCTVMFDFSMTVVVFIFATTIALGRVTSLRGESRWSWGTLTPERWKHFFTFRGLVFYFCFCFAYRCKLFMYSTPYLF